MINQETIIASSNTKRSWSNLVIRISGSNAISITEKVFKPKGNKKLSNQKSHTVHLGHLIKNNTNLMKFLLLI